MDNNLKARIFGQYLGQECIWVGDNDPAIVTAYWIHKIINMAAWDKVKLLLTPLELISDSDAIEVANMLFPEGEWVINGVGFGIKNFYNRSRQCFATLHKDLSFGGEDIEADYFHLPRAYQYLQSKGYALPYLGYSVADLVREGVIELKEKR